MELDDDGYEMETDGPGVLSEDEEATDHVFSSFYDSRTEDDNESPLFKAIRIGNIQTVQQLLDEGYSVNTVDLYGRTALHIAAESGQKDTISLLLDFGARIDVLDGVQRTVLQGAATNGNTDAVKLLLDRGASIDDTDTTQHGASLGFLFQ
jgi:ankyrin repeat protein